MSAVVVVSVLAHRHTLRAYQKKGRENMNAWLYYRLSRDEDQEQNSLQNQRQILVDYADQHGHKIVGESFDDNVSGMTFNRKGLGELEDAVDEGKVELVLVKDLSRLGRHRTQTDLFIDHLRQNNVKVYSVTEGIDTSNENDDLLIGFKQIYNDFYAKDISRKVRAGLRQKQKNKGLIESLPLGYLCDRNTKTIHIDEETAWIVQEIFRLYLDGYGLTTIAKEMNSRGIKSPEYYQRRRLADWKPDISKKYLWVQTAVKRILNNELYIGTMVNHKSVTSKIYKTKTFTSKDEQFRHEGFCEPIIDKDTWDKVQFLLSQRSEINPRNHTGHKLHRYAGIIKCADCGASLIARTRKVNGREYVEYTCNSSHRYGSRYCTPHTIRESQLDKYVAEELRSWQANITFEAERYDKIVKDWLRKKPMYDMQIVQHQRRIQSLKSQVEDLIIERMNDKERWDIFTSMIEKRESEVTMLEKRIADLQEYDKVCKERKEQLSDTAETLKGVLAQSRISDISLRMFVKHVKVHQNEDKSLELTFELNGSFEDSTMAFVGEENETGILID